MREPPVRRPGARIFDLLMLALGLFLLAQAYTIAGFEALSSPGALPLAAAVVMVLAACASLLKPLAPGEPSSVGTALRQLLTWRLVLFATLIALLAAGLERLGFLLAGVVFLLLSFLVLDRRRPRRALVIAVVATLALWVLFRLVFEVLLPEGIVPERAILAWIEDSFAAMWASP